MARYIDTVNFPTKVFMVLLRIAIGWHLLYEGYDKYRTLGESQPWSAEQYLRYSTGPFRESFRRLIDDVDGETALSYDATTTAWTDLVGRASTNFDLPADARTKLEEKLKELGGKLEAYLNSPDVKEKVAKYLDQLAAFRDRDRQPLSPFEVDRHRKWYGELEQQRKSLVAPVNAMTNELRASVIDVAQMEERNLPAWRRIVGVLATKTELEKVNMANIAGLMIFGGGMVLGLFSRICSLGAAVMLGLFYFSMPPWPGLPPNPLAEGHYLIVNKNLIEMIACLMLCFAPTGQWGGLDALIHGLINRPLFGVGRQEIRDKVEADEKT